MDNQTLPGKMDPAPPKAFTLETFKKANDTMIATNVGAYDNSYFNMGKGNYVRDYSEEEVRSIISSGSTEAQQTLSRNYFAANGFYKQIIMHYATLLKYYGILIPRPGLGKSLQDKAIAKRYFNASDLVDKVNLEILGEHITQRVLIDGIYYGVVQTLDKATFTLMDLPFKYCRTRFQDQQGNSIVEFNVSYFDTIREEADRAAALRTYPKVISTYYRKWSKKKGLKPWVFLPSDVGVAFNLIDARPYFLSIIPATIQYDKAVENELEKEIEEIKKMVVHKIPHLADGTLLFEPEEVADMHRGAVKMLQASNPHLSVFTTYGDVDVPSLKTSDAVTNNTLKNMMQNTYAAAGVSGELFAATGSSSLGTSLKFDTALMMVLANKISLFVTSLANKLYSNGSVSFKYRVLPITYHNESDYQDNYFKLASSGYSYLLPAIAQGISQFDLINLKSLENDVLKLQDHLIPLSSAYTQSVKSDGDDESKTGKKQETPANSDPATDDEGGRPPKDELDRTEKTNQNRESKDKTGG